MQKNRKLIVVLGMHRSGTSALTRGLQVLGVDLGHRFVPPLEGNNPTGFWEDADINDLNIRVLRSLGSDWHNLAPFQENYLEQLRQEGFVSDAAKILGERFKSSTLYGFKDPRIPMLLPFWQEVFRGCELNVAYVLSLRNPISVAQSLAKRDGFSAEKSQLLWLRSVLSSLSVTNDSDCIVVDYDLWMKSTGAEINRVAKALNLVVDQSELDIYIDDFLDQSLRHSQYTSCL